MQIEKNFSNNICGRGEPMCSPALPCACLSFPRSRVGTHNNLNSQRLFSPRHPFNQFNPL